MKFLSSDGIVINKRDTGEADRYLTLFTPRYGKVNLYIKGIRKSKKRDRNAADVLSLSKFIFYKKSENMIVSSFDLNDPFMGIRMDMEKINIAMYLLSVLNFTIVENQRNSYLYNIFYKTLKYLEESEEKSKKYLIICYFLSKIIDEEGIGFHLSEGNYFDIEKSKFFTERTSNSWMLGEDEKEILEVLVVGGQGKKIRVKKLGKIIRVINIMEKYINYHLHTNLNFKHFLGEDIKDAEDS